MITNNSHHEQKPLIFHSVVIGLEMVLFSESILNSINIWLCFVIFPGVTVKRIFVICVRICIYMCVCVFAYVYEFVGIRMKIHMCTHTHIYIYTNPSARVDLFKWSLTGWNSGFSFYQIGHYTKVKNKENMNRKEICTGQQNLKYCIHSQFCYRKKNPSSKTYLCKFICLNPPFFLRLIPLPIPVSPTYSQSYSIVHSLFFLIFFATSWALVCFRSSALTSSHSRLSGVCRIHRLHLCRGIIPFPNKCPVAESAGAVEYTDCFSTEG